MTKLRILLQKMMAILLVANMLAISVSAHAFLQTKTPRQNEQHKVVWERNYNNEFFKESLDNIVALSAEKYGSMALVSSAEMEQGRAFSELTKGKIDIFIASASIEREQKVKPIYVPLDRGLLGFRLCLINKNAPSFNKIRSAKQFVQQGFTIGLGSHWPDANVYRDNGFNIVTSPVYESLFSMLNEKRFDCFSRSINEISTELSKYQGTNIAEDNNLLFIYPNADFIFVTPNNPDLQKRINFGLQKAIENYSFYEIFDHHFNNKLLEHRVYERKLMLLKNDRLSAAALLSINKYGIAGFLNPIVETERQVSAD